MTAAIPRATDLPAASFHADSNTLRFWVEMPDGQVMGASLSTAVLRYRFNGQPDGSDAVALYHAHRRDIEAAVIKRVDSGSREPVMLREYDLPTGARES